MLMHQIKSLNLKVEKFHNQKVNQNLKFLIIKNNIKFNLNQNKR